MGTYGPNGVFAAVALGMAIACNPAVGAEDADKMAEIVKAADWKKMETVRVEMIELGDKLAYKPSRLALKANTPYKLELVNTGRKKHYYTAPAFFRSVAFRKIQSNKDGEIKAPYLTAVELYEGGGQLDMYFVTVKPGTYDVQCTIDDHLERGMKGEVVVE